MYKKKIAKKYLTLGLAFSVVFSGMPTMSAMADTTEAVIAETEVEGEVLVISEKSDTSETVAAARKAEKQIAKEQKKAEKEARKEAKQNAKEEKKAEKEQQKAEKKRLQKEKHDKTSVKASVEDFDNAWNITAVTQENSESTYVADGMEAVVTEPVKVAILDSGIDYTSDIDVYMRKNFISGQDEVSIIYEDLCGHGTSVAGIIAAKDNEDGITGINPNVQLYSARILDENKQAPLSRVIEAIDWAIEQNVDIINISFGTLTDSEELHAAIQRAYAQDILIVAAAGNNGVVEYPAAYDEVIAVGAVGADGERAEGSAVGDELELVAPGEQLVSTGAFGGICVAGGTSLAAPHVTAVASVLWQKDRSVSADFIRSLLAFTANQYGEDYEYGYGLVDLEFALSQYDAFKEVYVADDSLSEEVSEAVADGTLEVNEKPVVEFEDVAYVEGSWNAAEHKGFVTTGFTAAEITIIKRGAVAPDKYFSGMYRFSEYHGFKNHRDNQDEYCCNYVYCYIYLTKIAAEVRKGTSPSAVNGLKHDCKIAQCDRGDYCVEFMNETIFSVIRDDGIQKYTDGEKDKDVTSWREILGAGNVTNKNKSLYIYGLALHTVTDAFAHSSYQYSNGTWSRIKHTYLVNDKIKDADNVAVVPARIKCAEYISGALVECAIYGYTAKVSDFYIVGSSAVYDNSFKLGNLSQYIEAIDSEVYKQYKETYNAMSFFEPDL